MFKVKNNFKTLVGVVALLGYFSLLIFTPIHMMEMADMNMPMEHCPFALGEHVICTMTISQYLREWQGWLQGYIPFVKIFVDESLLFAFTYILVISPPVIRLFLYHKRQGRIKLFSTLQKLFSKGILNPKLF